MPTQAENYLLEQKDNFSKKLLAWFHEFQRPLPWRTAPSLYKTVLSEFMLQQTQVDTALPYFHNWLNLFPNFQTLANAPEDAVLKAWEGLGYYNRARNLHKLAKELTSLPEIPTTPDAWIKLPGVGPYTAAAITSIAFNHPTAVVDGNVVRVLSRLTANNTQFKDNASATKAFTKIANLIITENNPNSHNQAMMELGATTCHRQKPLCTICPLFPFCQAAHAGNPEDFPKLTPKKITKLTHHRAFVLHNGKLLLQKRSACEKRLANTFELPLLTPESTPASAPLAIKKRGISNERIEEHIHKIAKHDWDSQKTQHTNLHWLTHEELQLARLSGPHRKWITQLLNTP